MMPAHIETPTRPNSTSKTTPIDLKFLASQAGDDRQLVEELLQMFVKQARCLSHTMRTESDMEAIMAAAHTLKGTARAVGAARIEAGAEAIETEGLTDKSLETLHRDVDEACDYVASLLR
ncbi:MAG: Hpt domain-containing protein [Pseudomonadota bacterium]